MRKFWLTGYETEVQSELLRIGHQNLRAMITGSLVFTPLMLLGTWGHASPAGLAWWLGVSMAGNAAGWWAWWRFRGLARGTRALDATGMQHWMWAHFGVTLVKGLAVGSLGVLLVPGDPVHDLVPLIGYAGSAGYSVAGNAAHDLPAFLVSLVLATLLMVAFATTRLPADQAVVVGLCLLYAAMLTWVAVQSHRTIIETIRLRLANERLAREEAQARAAAERANRDKSEFLAAASHDLRQPVHAMLLLVEALRQRTPGSDPAALLTSLAEAGHAIRDLFNGLMELSRLESGTEPLLALPLQPALLAAQVVRRHAEQAAQQGLALRLRVGRGASAAWVRTDRIALERALDNLLTNALRYTVHGGVLVTLRARRDGALRVAVHDSGPGIEATDLQRIFEPYVQLANPERDRRRGLGLGLAIVQRSMQRLGGTVSVVSARGRGSRFELLLPATLRCPAPLPEAEAGAVVPDLAPLARRRVLLIDDDPMVREATAQLLRTWNVDLRCAPGPQAVAEVAGADWQPELLLCDQRLPGADDGLAVLAQLQERWPDSAAVLQTGEPPERVRAQAESAGYPVLYKPVAPALLASTLRALLPVRVEGGAVRA
ncbi:MAG: ATP-binding protein [Rubrivivax sp.]